MKRILLKSYEHLKLYIILRIFRVLTILLYILYILFLEYIPPIDFFLINSSLYSPYFADASSITVKIKQFPVFSLMIILIINVYM